MAGRNKIRQCRNRRSKNSTTKATLNMVSNESAETGNQSLTKDEGNFVKSESLAMQNTSLDNNQTEKIIQEVEEFKGIDVDSLSNDDESPENDSKKEDSANVDELWDYYPKQVQKVLKKKRISKESKNYSLFYS